MDAIEVIRAGFGDLHRELRADLAECEPEWLWWQAGPEVNHIGFLFWHGVRDEDVVVSHVCKAPQAWAAEGWHERFEMDAKEQGTGWSQSAMGRLRYDVAAFMEYAERTWARTQELLPALGEADLDPPAWEGSEWTVARQLLQGCLGHGWLHLGEIRFIKGLKGWRFRE